ncbi:GDP-L-fucose synthase [bacterium]|nr:GDP-L-fucose synthase [bacterium]
MDKNAKIYVAGHTGMVGSAIWRKLELDGFSNLVGKSIDELDLTKQSAVQKFFDEEKPYYVFLAAARVGGIYANNVYRGEFIYQNLAIQNNVIHTAHEHGVKKLLFLGSSCIYPKHAPQPMQEEHLLTGELEPTNEPYAIAKIAGLKMCESYKRQYGDDFISAMPTNMYGMNDNFDLKNSHVLPALIRKFHLAKLLQQGGGTRIRTDLECGSTRREVEGASDEDLERLLASFGVTADSVEVWGTGAPRREFLHVDDCASALVYMMQNYNGEQHLNVGTGEDISIRELAELVKDIVGFEGEIRFNDEYPDGTPRKLMDVSRLKNLGWAPAISLEEGIKRVYDFYCESTSA